MVDFMFEIVKTHNDVEWCVELMPMGALVSVSTSCPSPSTWVSLIVIVKKDMPSPTVDNFHVKDQHKHNLAIKVDVEVSSPCKNKDIWLLKLLWILLQWYVKISLLRKISRKN